MEENKTTKKTAPRKRAPKKTKQVVASCVKQTGEIRLSNGERTHCAVGRLGPEVKRGDVFVKTKTGWEPKK